MRPPPPQAAGPAQDGVPLSRAMREGSRAEHEAAEASPFLAALLAGRIAASGYVAYLERLRLVYAALEEAGRRRRDDPWVAAVHDPDLERLGAIDADLDHWRALARADPRPSGRPAEHLCEQPAEQPATGAASAYADRVREAAHWPGGLAAHHYTRYLGDLSGGQAVGRALDRAYDLGGRGLAFYAFDAVPRPKTYKDAYRARLDALPATPAQAERVVAEVRVAFGLNQALFDELGREIHAHLR